jgi:hypothetical protein
MRKVKCDSCEYATIVEGDTLWQRRISCGQMGSWYTEIKWNVYSCNQYKNKLDKDEYELEQIAWILEVSKGRVVGFVSPAEGRKRGVRGV